MDTPSRPGRSWLAGLLLALLAICAGALVKEFWSTIHPEPAGQPAESDTASQSNFPEFDFDEALRVLGDPRSSSIERAAAMERVRHAGTRAIPDLIVLLDSESDEIRWQAMSLLGGQGSQSAAAVDHLLADCADPDPRIRETALRAVWEIDPDHAALRDTLRRMLKEGPDLISLLAIDYLGQLKPPAVEDLLPYVERDQHSALGSRATQRLRELALHDRELLRRLLKIGVRFFAGGPRRELESLVRTETDDEIHLAALLSLAGMRRDDVPAASVNAPDGSPNDSAKLYFAELVDAVRRHRDASRSHELAIWLSRSGPKSLPALRELFRSKEHRARCEAAASITHHDKQAVDLLPELRQLLKTDVRGTEHAVWAVENLGPSGRAAIPELTILAKGSSYSAREARRVLSKLVAGR